MHTVDVTDASGRTPLHYAAITGNEETLTTLLLCNPDVNRISNDGTTPVHEAIIHNHPRKIINIQNFFLKIFVNIYIFIGILTLLIQHNSDVNILFQDYLPSLILSVYLQHKNIVELLIRLGIDPNVVDTNMGRSALHYSAYFHDNTTIFHLLLSSTVHQKININAIDDNQYSILDYARANIYQSPAIVNLLLQLNVFDPNRGEISTEHIQIEKPNIKIFQSIDELSLLKKNKKDEKKSIKIKK